MPDLVGKVVAVALDQLRYLPGAILKGGDEIQRPLAIVVIGGLVTSTLLTLLLLPVLFRWFGVSRSNRDASTI